MAALLRDGGLKTKNGFETRRVSDQI